MWEQLFERLVTGNGRTPHQGSTDKIDIGLDEAEVSLGIKLPITYRRFIHQFGPGELIGWFRIAGPVVEGAKNKTSWNLLHQYEAWQDPDGYLYSEVENAHLKRLVPLCSTGGGDTYFWDTGDVIDQELHEYGIYELDHSDFHGHFSKVANSFPDFIHEYCLVTFWPELQDPDGEEEPSQAFWSYW